MSARMFTAVLPPVTVAGQLAEFLEPRRQLKEPELRWTNPDAWHLTVAFMATVPQRRIDSLTGVLAEVAARTPPFQLRLAGARCFPNPARARVLCLGVSLGDKEISALSSRCRGAAAHCGVDVDGARFTPHLTLARMRRPLEATRWVREVDSFPGAEWLADELVLIESHLHDPGNRYEVAGRYQLGGGNGTQQGTASSADPGGVRH